MSDRMGGMRVEVTSREQDTPVTTLVRQLKDQVYLSGMLNTLCELHLPILSVDQIRLRVFNPDVARKIETIKR
jgi:hypothetical protein